MTMLRVRTYEFDAGGSYERTRGRPPIFDSLSNNVRNMGPIAEQIGWMRCFPAAKYRRTNVSISSPVFVGHHRERCRLDLWG